MTKDQNFSISQSALNVFNSNPGLVFDSRQVQAIQAGVLVSYGAIDGRVPKKGCINWLRFEADDNLTHMSLDGVLFGGSGLRILNLNDFRESLRSAQANGQSISFCYSSKTLKMDMLNVHKCGCPCDD